MISMDLRRKLADRLAHIAASMLIENCPVRVKKGGSTSTCSKVGKVPAAGGGSNMYIRHEAKKKCR